MLCCVGLIGGMAVGQYLGGPWAVIAPAAGFGIGLVADMKFMKGMHGKGGQHQHGAGPPAKTDAAPACGMEVEESKAQKEVLDENPEKKYVGKAQKAA